MTVVFLSVDALYGRLALKAATVNDCIMIEAWT